MRKSIFCPPSPILVPTIQLSQTQCIRGSDNSLGIPFSLSFIYKAASASTHQPYSLPCPPLPLKAQDPSGSMEQSVSFEALTNGCAVNLLETLRESRFVFIFYLSIHDNLQSPKACPSDGWKMNKNLCIYRLQHLPHKFNSKTSPTACHLAILNLGLGSVDTCQNRYLVTSDDLFSVRPWQARGVQDRMPGKRSTAYSLGPNSTRLFKRLMIDQILKN